MRIFRTQKLKDNTVVLRKMSIFSSVLFALLFFRFNHISLCPCLIKRFAACTFNICIQDVICAIGWWKRQSRRDRLKWALQMRPSGAWELHGFGKLKVCNFTSWKIAGIMYLTPCNLPLVTHKHGKAFCCSLLLHLLESFPINTRALLSVSTLL